MQDAHRRIHVLGAQVAADAIVSRSPASAQASSAEPGYTGEEFGVCLPERLTEEGPWEVYRASVSPHKLVGTFPAPLDHIRTLHDNFRSSVTRFPNVPMLGTRTRNDKGVLGAYSWITYGEAGVRATDIGSGMMHLGLAPKQFVGIYATNCSEWLLTDNAILSYSMIGVPLYDTLGPDAVEYIINHAELVAVACSLPLLPTLLATLHKCPTVHLVIVFGAPAGQALPLPAGGRCHVMRLEEVEALGRLHPRALIPPVSTDVATLCYTSGTTGVPKGAILTHGNMIGSAAGASGMKPGMVPGDKHISYLPLAHIYERGQLVVTVYKGMSIGFFSGNVLTLLEDVVELKPHNFPSVPRLWNRIHDRVMAGVRASPPESRAAFEEAFAYKREAYERGDATGGPKAAHYNKTVFASIRDKLGGNIKYLTTGSGPISTEVLMFLRICFDAIVLEGYGMTETSNAASLSRVGDMSVGHVGAPLPCNEIKLVDIPEMNYFNSDKPFPRGEVCLRGPNIFKGYYKDEANTREALDADGWLHSGDVGAWLPGGRLKIIDRKKNIFKLAQGEYVAPEKIENIYMRSALVMQAFVYGDSLKSKLVAVVVPDPETLAVWAKQQNVAGDFAALCANPSVAAAVYQNMLEQGREAQLRGFEQVHAVRLVPTPFSVDNGLLTPTFKLKRPQCKAMFQALVEEMYAGLSDA